MLTIGIDQRRARLMRRHHLAGDAYASSVVEATAGVLGLHASDPASVYLSALARCPAAKLDDVSAALYDDRSLVKMLAMRRTMFVVPIDLAPVVHSAASLEIAARLRKQLVKQLSTLPTDPPIEGDVAAWLADVERGTAQALVRLGGEAPASSLAEAEPRLRTAILPTTDKKWDVKRNITTQVVNLMSAEGRLVRDRIRGSWVSRQHRWATAERWWPDGIPQIPEAEARVALVRRWLEVFGPATVADIQWWTGWTAGATKKALAGTDTVAVDLDGVEGIVLADDVAPVADVAPTAALLPALDPTPMGWQRRDWYLGPYREALFDRNGNIGPTIWWDGRIVGGWAIRPDGGIRWRLLEDVGVEADATVAQAAAYLAPRLDGTVVVPAFRTPLERELIA
jgi:hypothetical protein